MSLVFLFALVAPTWAADGQSGLLLPGAEPMAAGEGSVGAAAAAGLLAFVGLTAAGLAELSYAPHDRVALGGFLGSTAGLEPGISGMVWTRTTVLEEDWLRVSPYVYGVGTQRIGGGAGAGLAVEGGVERLRLDASIPLMAGWVEEGNPGLRALPLLGEAGVGVLLGAERRHRIRLGLPMLTWRYQAEAAHVELGATAGAWLAGLLRVGLRF